MKKKKSKPLLVLKGIQKTINGYHILKGIDLEIHRGEFIVIIGESGSGKSTLLSLLGAQDFSDEGEYWFNGNPIHKDLSEREILEFRTNHTGFIYQDFNLLPTLTIHENITFPADLSGKAYNNQRLAKLLEIFGLTAHKDKYPESLSGGEMQRTAILRSILLQPDLLLADEPTGNLDPSNAEKVVSIFKEFHKKGNTIILVTHSKKVAKAGSRVIEMSNGKIK